MMRTKLENDFHEWLASDAHQFIKAVCSIVLDQPVSDRMGQAWIDNLSEKIEKPAAYKKRFQFLAKNILAACEKQPKGTETEFISLYHLAEQAVQKNFFFKYIDSVLERLTLSDFHSVCWTIFDHARGDLDVILSEFTEWAAQGLPIYRTNADAGEVLVPDDDARVYFLVESAALGGLHRVYEPPNWMSELLVKRKDLETRKWFFSLDYMPEGDELLERRNGFRKQLDLPPFVSIATKIQSVRTRERESKEVLASALRPIIDLWPIVANRLNVSRVQAVSIVQDCLSEMEVSLYLENEWSGLYSPNRNRESVYRLIGDLSASEFAKNIDHAPEGWEKFCIAPTDFDYVLEYVERVHGRRPDEPFRALPQRAVNYRRAQMVSLDCLGERLAKAGNLKLVDALDYFWKFAVRSSTLELYDDSEFPSNSGLAAYHNDVADLTCMNSPDSDLLELSRYTVLPEDAARIEASLLVNELPGGAASMASDSVTNLQDPSYLDPNHPRYAPKLAAAVRAWENVRVQTGSTPKQDLDRWLSEHADEFGANRLSANAILECSSVANWAIKGGAPKTPG